MPDLTTDEILDLLTAAETGPDTLVRHVETLLADHIDLAKCEAQMEMVPAQRHGAASGERLCEDKHYCPPCVTYTGSCMDLFFEPDCKGGHQAACASDDPTEET
jgi:hypothetical protein